MLTKFLKKSLGLIAVLAVAALMPTDEARANHDYVCTIDIGETCVCEWGPWQDIDGVPTRECRGTRRIAQTYGSTRAGCPSGLNSVGYVDGFRYGGLIGYLEVSCVITQTDTQPPSLATSPQIFAASHTKPGVLYFSDDVSGVAEVMVKIESAESGESIVYSAEDSTTLNISGHDFSEAKKYDLLWKATDIAGNEGDWQTETGFFHVVANVPEWLAEDCLQAYQINCPSQIEFSTGTKISDSMQNHFVKVKLSDRYGNKIVSEDKIKSVDTTFEFKNTNALNQIVNPPTGNPTNFDTEGVVRILASGSTGDVTGLDANRDGTFEVQIRSFAPTSLGFPPIADEGFDIDFEKFSFDISGLGGLTGVGEVTGNLTADSNPHRRFAFAPTLVPIPDGLIWDGSNYVLDPYGVENITVNAIKRFRVDLQNDSDIATAAGPKIGIALDSGVDSVTWQDGKIERIDTSEGLDAALDLDTDGNTMFDGELFELNDWITSITASISKSLRFQATPRLAAGMSVADVLIADLDSYTCYTIYDTYVCHRGYGLQRNEDSGGSGGSSSSGSGGGESSSSGSGGSSSSGSGGGSSSGSGSGSSGSGSGGSDSSSTSTTVARLYNPGIEILGSIRSTAGTSSKQINFDVNQSLGDVVQNEFQDAITRNLASLLANPSSACSGDTTVESASELLDLACWQREDGVLYLGDGDLTLDLAGGLLPSGARTLVIENGDLHIKSDLSYPSAGGSLGVIVLNGDIFVYPEVTNLVGAIYAEGSVISVNVQGHYGEDASSTCDGSAGFCDRSYELRNQLYWKGLLATRNTIGGSDKSPADCPAGVSCDSRNTARVYDLAYLRTFHPNSGGERSSGTTSDASFVVEYDSRIQSNTPPLFEATTGSTSNELGASLLEVVLRSVWPF